MITLDVTGATTTIIHVLDKQRASQNAPHLDKLSRREAGQRQPPLLVGVATPA
jgi:hypothetical protein